MTLTTVNPPQAPECDIADSIRDIDPVRHKDEQHKGDAALKAEILKAEHHLADLAEALRQVEPIKAKDDLAEALRQIEPIRSKDRNKEREDRGKEDFRGRELEWGREETTQTLSVKEFSATSKVTSNMATLLTPQVTSTNSTSTYESEHRISKSEAIARRKNSHSRRYDER